MNRMNMPISQAITNSSVSRPDLGILVLTFTRLLITETLWTVMRKLINKLLWGIALIIMINQSAYSSESTVNNMIDDNFIAWSNSIPEKEAITQLKNFLSTFGYREEVEKWLKSKGFKIDGPRLMHEIEAKKIHNIFEKPAYYFIASWNLKNKGVIFADSWIAKLEARLFVYGVGIEFVYTEPFTIQSLGISRSRL